jgi:hypothetical protein
MILFMRSVLFAFAGAERAALERMSLRSTTLSAFLEGGEELLRKKERKKGHTILRPSLVVVQVRVGDSHASGL